MAKSVKGQIVPATEHAEVDPSDDEDNEDKLEDMHISNPAFDTLVDTEGNTQAIKDFTHKKAQAAQHRKLAKLGKENEECMGKGKDKGKGPGKERPGKERRKGKGPGKGGLGKGRGTGKGPLKVKVPVIGPPTSTLESEDEVHLTLLSIIAANMRADMEQSMRESRSRNHKAQEDISKPIHIIVNPLN